MGWNYATATAGTVHTLTTPIVVGASNSAAPLVITSTNDASPALCESTWFSMPSLTGVAASETTGAVVTTVLTDGWTS